ncbi:NosD domain-containing protein [Nonomuraea sp. NPDC050663]|uniref:NosD domain-containing protein n=1 Tax=Nonomuraea sp. NPDC050663 TaxID=3364370 RepID=UPI0037BD6FAC
MVALWRVAIVVTGVIGTVAPLPALPALAVGRTYLVLNTSDSGFGSLRDAITRANDNAGADVIAFRIPGAGPHVIVPGRRPLPAITDPVAIDGFTQSGAIPPSEVAPATLKIEIDASNVNAGIGLDVRTNDSLLTGLVINGAPLAGGALHTDIKLTGHRNRVTASHIGTDMNGQAAVTAGYGVQIHGNDNVIGGSAVERNVISGQYGVWVTGGTRNLIAANRIGTDAFGSGGLGAGIAVRCISIEEADATTVSDNLISDCGTGVYVAGDQNKLRGNLIGTDVTGTRAIGNGEGIWIHGGDGNQVGGTGPGEGNIISGNDWFGIELSQNNLELPDANVIQGNRIGVDVSGAVPLPNGGAIPFGKGITVAAGTANVIGGAESSAANVVSANTGDGIDLSPASTGTRVIGNRIGTDLTGTADLGNSESGIEIGGSGNQVGDGSVAGHNVIAHNGHDGVEITNGTHNSILVNSIRRNSGLGIDLAPDGHNTESLELDPLDGDVGANDLQNAPSLVSAVRTPTAIQATWTLDSLPRTEMRIEFYWSGACDPIGFGEGLLHLPGGLTTITTGPAGHADGTAELAALPTSGVITATATPLAADGSPTSTSEFSECMVIRE